MLKGCITMIQPFSFIIEVVENAASLRSKSRNRATLDFCKVYLTINAKYTILKMQSKLSKSM